MGKPAFPAA
jgi:hypothetical protein